ncbi:MAG: methyltransferase domain-containing protein [Verrucomicrobiota bacterium]
MNIPENSNTASPSVPAGGGVDWEARYTVGDTPWDKGLPHPALAIWLEKHPLRGRVLVPGCGAGHDVREIARRCGAEVIGMDIAPSAIQRARLHTPMDRESYVLGDFLAGDAGRFGPFDALFEHTCFCAIPPSRRGEYLREAAATLRPGGIFLGVFFGNPENDDPHSPPFRSPAEEVDALFAAAFERIDSCDNPSTYPERGGREYLRVFRRRAD